MKYRAEIDGLRALAVMPVILFHAGFEWFSGGFVGVDVFFVISGYLITTILISEMAEGKFSIISFYERRARRILPALYFLLIIALLYGLFTSPFFARDIFQSIFATTVFAENILLYIESSNYFDVGVDDKLLFHTWSLGVEEQYYLFFPIFLFFTWSFGKKKIFWILSGFAFFSLMLSEWSWRNEPIANFYLAPTRAWELFAGSLIAFYIDKRGQQSGQIKAFAGISLIACAIYFYDETTPFPSLYTLVPVIGAALIIIFADSQTFIAKIISNKYLVGIGLISYSAYLWHQPIFVLYDREMADYFLNAYPNIDWRPVLIMFILGISAFSYFVIEKPFRYQVPQKVFIFIFISITIFLLSISFYGHKTVGFEESKIRLFSKDESLYINYFRELERARSLWNDDYSINSQVLVIGDSMASDLKAALETQNLAVNRLDLDGLCFDELIKNDYGCSISMKDLIKITSAYQYVFIASDFVLENSIGDAFILKDILADTTKNTFIVTSFRFKHASDLSYQFTLSEGIDEDTIKKDYYNSLTPEVHEMRSLILEKNDVFVIDKGIFFCNEDSKECKLYNDNGKALIYDELHLTVEGLNFFGNKLTNFLCQNDTFFCQ